MEDIDVRLPQNERALNLITSKESDTQNWSSLSLVECNARKDSYHSHMYGIAMLWRNTPPSDEQMEQLHHDYPLRAYSQRLCHIGPDFQESLDDDVPTKEESNEEKEKKLQYYD